METDNWQPINCLRPDKPPPPPLFSIFYFEVQRLHWKFRMARPWDRRTSAESLNYCVNGWTPSKTCIFFHVLLPNLCDAVRDNENWWTSGVLDGSMIPEVIALNAQKAVLAKCVFNCLDRCPILFVCCSCF